MSVGHWRTPSGFVSRLGGSPLSTFAAGWPACSRPTRRSSPRAGTTTRDEEGRAVRLAMTILVRDAEDLIETNLRYHRAQGVDLFLIGDNGSTDRTLEILEPYREAGLVEIDHIEGDARHVWSAGR